MTIPWLSLPTLLIIDLGFAGLLGTHLYYLRAHAAHRRSAARSFPHRARSIALALLLGGFVLLPPLSFPPLPQWLGWLAALLVVALFAFRPKPLPARLWTLSFAFRYAALTMLLVALWGLLSGFTSPQALFTLAALLAAALAWHRSRRLLTSDIGG